MILKRIHVCKLFHEPITLNTQYTIHFLQDSECKNPKYIYIRFVFEMSEITIITQLSQK